MQEKIKIAVITPFSTGNIGTVLQAFATQTLLNRFGYENAIVDYKWDNIESPFRPVNLIRRGPVSYLSAIGGYLIRLPKRKKLRAFIAKMKLTEKVKKKDLFRLQSRYDYFIVGSDCVWNVEAFGLESAYLLDFVDDSRRKGNFSSSFASNDIPRQYREIFRERLGDFKHLSVREEKGRELIHDLTGKDATVVLDPTLVLDSGFWTQIAEKSSLNIPQDYIFVAEYAVCAEMLEDAVKLSEKLHCTVICAFPPKGKWIKAKTILSSGPEDFMYLIKHARYVMTDSYHMTIFSINFNVNFITYITNTALPAVSKYDSILQYTGLPDRMVYVNRQKKETVDLEKLTPINYGPVNEKLEKARKISVSYLENLLREADTELHGEE